MIDPAIFHAAVGGIVSDQVHEHVTKYFGDDEDSVPNLLKRLIHIQESILKQSSLEENPDIPYTFNLGTNVESFTVPVWPRNHLCALLPSGVTINYTVPGMTAIARSITTGGWYQLDLPQGTNISASAATPVYFRWSDNPLGIAF